MFCEAPKVQQKVLRRTLPPKCTRLGGSKIPSRTIGPTVPAALEPPAQPAPRTENAIPEGARVQLDPSFNVDAQPWPAWKKMIARALQTYGAYVVDTGGALAIRGVTNLNQHDYTWESVQVPEAPSLADLPWQWMRVLALNSCN